MTIGDPPPKRFRRNDRFPPKMEFQIPSKAPDPSCTGALKPDHMGSLKFLVWRVDGGFESDTRYRCHHLCSYRGDREYLGGTSVGNDGLHPSAARNEQLRSLNRLGKSFAVPIQTTGVASQGGTII